MSAQGTQVSTPDFPSLTSPEPRKEPDSARLTTVLPRLFAGRLIVFQNIPSSGVLLLQNIIAKLTAVVIDMEPASAGKGR